MEENSKRQKERMIQNKGKLQKLYKRRLNQKNEGEID